METKYIEMTLSKALQYKNRLVKRISALENDITAYNIQQASSDVDVAAKFEQFQCLKKHLVDLKMKIQESTYPVRKHILEISELKSLLNFLVYIDTSPRESFVGDQIVCTKPVITRHQVEDLVEAAEDEIDKLQSELDAYNHNNNVYLDVPVF